MGREARHAVPPMFDGIRRPRGADNGAGRGSILSVLISRAHSQVVFGSFWRSGLSAGDPHSLALFAAYSSCSTCSGFQLKAIIAKSQVLSNRVWRPSTAEQGDQADGGDQRQPGREKDQRRHPQLDERVDNGVLWILWIVEHLDRPACFLSGPRRPGPRLKADRLATGGLELDQRVSSAPGRHVKSEAESPQAAPTYRPWAVAARRRKALVRVKRTAPIAVTPSPATLSKQRSNPVILRSHKKSLSRVLSPP